MVEALRRRKAHPLDITISLGRPDDTQLLSLDQDTDAGLMPHDESQESEEDEAKELDQAPDASPVGEEDDQAPEADQSNELLMDQELKKANFGRGSLAAFKSKQLSKAKV